MTEVSPSSIAQWSLCWQDKHLLGHQNESQGIKKSPLVSWRVGGKERLKHWSVQFAAAIMEAFNRKDHSKVHDHMALLSILLANDVFNECGSESGVDSVFSLYDDLGYDSLDGPVVRTRNKIVEATKTKDRKEVSKLLSKSFEFC
jgi:hypothetical protein